MLHSEVAQNKKEKEIDKSKKLKVRNLAELFWKINEGLQEDN